MSQQGAPEGRQPFRTRPRQQRPQDLPWLAEPTQDAWRNVALSRSLRALGVAAGSAVAVVVAGAVTGAGVAARAPAQAVAVVVERGQDAAVMVAVGAVAVLLLARSVATR